MKKSPCDSCALVPGAAANCEPENNLTALICAWGPLPFWCHHGWDWENNEKTTATRYKELSAQRRPICQGWVREVQRLRALGFYKLHAEARKAFAMAAIEQLQIMKHPEANDLDKQDASDLLEFYVTEFCKLEKKARANEQAQ